MRRSALDASDVTLADRETEAILNAKRRIAELEAVLRECDEELCKLWQRLDDESNKVGDLQERLGALFQPPRVSI